MEKVITGSCLCGVVTYRVEAAPLVVGDCYCLDCRKSSGTAYCTHAGVPDAALALTGTLSTYTSAADSGNSVRRAFCPSCGSAILSTNSGMPGMTFIRVSSMADPDLAPPQMTVYAKRAPAWARIDRDKPVYEGMATDVAAQASELLTNTPAVPDGSPPAKTR